MSSLLLAATGLLLVVAVVGVLLEFATRAVGADAGDAGPLRRARSPQWPRIRRAHLEAEPICQWCGGTRSLEVHHIHPYHIYPSMELDASNLVTLCEEDGRECHLRVGHFCSFEAGYNLDIRTDCEKHRADGAYVPPEFRGHPRSENHEHARAALTLPVA